MKERWKDDVVTVSQLAAFSPITEINSNKIAINLMTDT